MATGDKPYRVYRGGRVKGKVPTPGREARPPSRDGRRRVYHGAPPPKKRRRRRNWPRRIGVAILVLFVLGTVWFVASYLAFSSGVDAANKRLGPKTRATLTEQNGLLLTRSTTILLLGTDHAATKARRGFNRSDSIMLVRTDPKRDRVAYLSIPRDLRVDIPGYGASRINVAFQVGGPALAARSVRALTGLPINHIAIVDFGAFKGLIDELGGVEIDVPRPIVSNRFDCPYATPAQCQRWQGWRFRKGKQHMDGRRALIYSRIRENRLDTSETDVTRTQRQQDVIEALGSKLTSFRTMLRLPFVGDELLKPLTTDLSAGEFMQLAWRKFRASPERDLHCRLGGTPSDIGGQSVLIGGDEDNRAALAAFKGQAAPQPPRPGEPFAAGCVVGKGRLK
jgi:polyisoprenyl-teichoic acid--peptidoglycan teichoic acid transferase